MLGGLRDPLSGWDFADVPTPPLLASNMTGVRDKIIKLADVVADLQYVGISAANPNNCWQQALFPESLLDVLPFNSFLERSGPSDDIRERVPRLGCSAMSESHRRMLVGAQVVFGYPSPQIIHRGSKCSDCVLDAPGSSKHVIQAVPRE